jgi:hypothetical protein
MTDQAGHFKTMVEAEVFKIHVHLEAPRVWLEPLAAGRKATSSKTELAFKMNVGGGNHH